MSEKEKETSYFGVTFETSKHPHINLDNFLARTYSCSTLWLASYISLFYRTRNNGDSRLLEYAKKCIDYIDKKYDPSVNRCSGRINDIYYSMKLIVKNIESGNYLPTNDEIHYENYDLDYCILGKRYSEKYFEIQDELLKKNYQMNMDFFKQLDKDNFNNELDHFLRNHYRFKKITDLKDADFNGCYILVLDKYKQVYIGCSTCVGTRIFQHWCKKLEYDRRIFGKPEESKISIDSFGYKDITRIYAIKLQCDKDRLGEYEKNYIEEFSNQYVTNRISGGTPSIFTLIKTR